MIGKDPRRDVGRAAGRKRHQERDGPRGPGLPERNARAERASKDDPAEENHTSPPRSGHCAWHRDASLALLPSADKIFGTRQTAMPVDGEPLLQRELLEQLAEPFSAQELFDCLPDTVYFIKNARCEY